MGLCAGDRNSVSVSDTGVPIKELDCLSTLICQLLLHPQIRKTLQFASSGIKTEDKMIKNNIMFSVCIHLGDIQKRRWGTGKFTAAFWRGQSLHINLGPALPLVLHAAEQLLKCKLCEFLTE